jgi:tetratricopeptide (TPR) repeat protein
MSIADEGRDTSWPMPKQIEGTLAAHPPNDFRFDFLYFGDENHATTAIESTLQALKLLYARWQVPWTAVQAGPEAIAAHSAALSAEFGCTIPVTEQALTQAAASLTQTGNTATAIRVYEFTVARFPKSENAYMALAEAYLKAGDREKARTCLQRLLAVNPQHAAARKKLAELRPPDVT